MAEEAKVEAPPEDEVGLRKPNPQDNPRNDVLARIAKQAVAEHEAEIAENAKLPTMDEEGNIFEPAPAAALSSETPPEGEAPPPVDQPPAALASPEEQQPPTEAPPPTEEVIDPDKLYEVVVEGQKMQVPGRAIIDAGKRTFSKEAAADHRLKIASQLLEEAERRLAATPEGGVAKPADAAPAAGEKTEAELAHMLQFGTPEQSQEAVRVLLARGMSQEQIVGTTSVAARAAARDEFAFQRAKGYLQAEFGDVMAKEPLRRLFFAEEDRRRKEGDKRPYIDLYKDIGEGIRKDFAIPKPATSAAEGQPTPGTREARVAAKAAAPTVPRTAATRLQEGGAVKPRSTSEIIAGMAAARGKDQLTATKRS